MSAPDRNSAVILWCRGRLHGVLNVRERCLARNASDLASQRHPRLGGVGWIAGVSGGRATCEELLTGPLIIGLSDEELIDKARMQPLIVADARDIANRAGGHTPQAFVNRNCAVASDCRNDRRTPQSLTEEPSQPVGIASVVVGKDCTRRSESVRPCTELKARNSELIAFTKSASLSVYAPPERTRSHRNDRLNKLGAPLRLNQRVNRLHRCQCGEAERTQSRQTCALDR